MHLPDHGGRLFYPGAREHIALSPPLTLAPLLPHNTASYHSLVEAAEQKLSLKEPARMKSLFADAAACSRSSPSTKPQACRTSIGVDHSFTSSVTDRKDWGFRPSYQTHTRLLFVTVGSPTIRPALRSLSKPDNPSFPPPAPTPSLHLPRLPTSCPHPQEMLVAPALPGCC